MRTRNFTRKAATFALAGTLAFGMAACSSDDDGGDDGEATEEMATDDMATEDMATEDMATEEATDG